MGSTSDDVEENMRSGSQTYQKGEGAYEREERNSYSFFCFFVCFIMFFEVTNKSRSSHRAYKYKAMIPHPSCQSFNKLVTESEVECNCTFGA